jgi:hypothetical protein
MDSALSLREPRNDAESALYRAFAMPLRLCNQTHKSCLVSLP